MNRGEQLALLPRWLSKRIEVNRFETLRLLERAQSEIPDSALVLDAGSGEGRYKPYFEHTNYLGIDLAVGQVDWDYSGLDVLGNLRKLPFPEGIFDAAVCIQTLEHVNEPKEVIHEIGRVLKPGGRFYLSAPMNWHQHQKPHDYFRYTSFGFQYLLDQSGLDLIDIWPMGGYFWFLSLNLQMMHHWLFPAPTNRYLHWLQLPFKLLTQFVFFMLLPIPLYYLDRLDKIKDHTIGWVCVAEKRRPHDAPTTSSQ